MKTSEFLNRLVRRTGSAPVKRKQERPNKKDGIEGGVTARRITRQPPEGDGRVHSHVIGRRNVPRPINFNGHQNFILQLANIRRAVMGTALYQSLI